MKKLILLPLSAMLIFTGCNSSSENSELSTENLSITTNNNSSENSQLSAEEIESMCLNFVTDYYDGIKECDFDKCFKHFPDFYLDMLKKEVDLYGETHEEYMQYIYDVYVENFGDDFNISFQVSDSGNNKGILYLYDDSLEEFKDIFKETYNTDVNLEEAYTIYIATDTSGSNDSFSQDYEWFILKIDGEYYLYENYYETNSIE